MSQATFDLDRWIGDRLRLRDLRIFRTTVESGSMAKAARRLAITQPAVSQAVAGLEAALGVRLLDRGPRGVATTVCGEALLRRGDEAFDALRQAMRDIAFLVDPGAGEVVVGASESHIAGGFLSEIVDGLSRRHPQMSVRVVEANTAAVDLAGLRNRTLDVMLGRIARDRSDTGEGGDFEADVLFEEAIHLVAGAGNAWAHDPAIGLADLVDRPFILAPEGTAVHELVRAAFRAEGLPAPRVSVTTYSMNLRLQLLTQGPYVTAFPSSLVTFNAGRWPLKTLPVSLGAPLPVAIVTLRRRTLSPAVRVFVDHAKQATRAMR